MVLPAKVFAGPSRKRNAEPGRVAALEPPFGLGPAALEVAIGEPAQRAVAMGLTEVGAKLDRLVVVSHGLGPMSHAGEGHSDVVPGFGGIGPQGQGGAQPDQSFIERAQIGKGDTQVHLRVERAGLDLEGPPIKRDGTLGTALVPEGDPQVVQDAEVVGLELVGAKVIRHRFGRTTLFPDGGAQIVQDVGVVGIQSECFAETEFGFGDSFLAEQ